MNPPAAAVRGPDVSADATARVAMAALALCREMPYPPTMREVGERAGLQPVTAMLALRALRAAGVLTYIDGDPRTIRPLVRVVAADR